MEVVHGQREGAAVLWCVGVERMRLGDERKERKEEGRRERKRKRKEGEEGRGGRESPAKGVRDAEGGGLQIFIFEFQIPTKKSKKIILKY
jgi:hypothetical protein